MEMENRFLCKEEVHAKKLVEDVVVLEKWGAKEEKNETWPREMRGRYDRWGQPGKWG